MTSKAVERLTALKALKQSELRARHPALFPKPAVLLAPIDRSAIVVGRNQGGTPVLLSVRARLEHMHVIGTTGGGVSLQTGGGNVKINAVKGSIRAETGGGNLSVISGLQGAVLETAAQPDAQTIADLQQAADAAQREGREGNKSNPAFGQKSYQIEQVVARMESGQQVDQQQVDEALQPVRVW